MSTRVHYLSERCPDQDALISFLYDEFDGSEALDRRTLTKHLETCDRCARQLASLGGVRERLRAWQVPEISPLAFRIASNTPAHHAGGAPGWGGWMKPAFPLAAAAVLVLGAALGLARLEIQYDKNGFHVQTGWGHPAQAAGRSQTPGVTTAGVAGPLAPVTEANSTPWRADLQSLAQALRQEIQASHQAEAARVGTSASDAALLKRVQQLIDQSEVRQQQNLALRITELERGFDLQRRSDMAVIEQGFGRLASQRELDTQQQRLLLNAIRTSQQLPAQR